MCTEGASKTCFACSFEIAKRCCNLRLHRFHKAHPLQPFLQPLVVQHRHDHHCNLFYNLWLYSTGCACPFGCACRASKTEDAKKKHNRSMQAKQKMHFTCTEGAQKIVINVVDQDLLCISCAPLGQAQKPSFFCLPF